jgi:chitinase
MRRRILCAVIAFTVWTAGSTTPAQQFDRNLVGYYTSWSVYARDYHVPDIPADKINVINYAFANIEDGEIVLGDPYADIDKWYPGDSWHPDSLRGCFHRLQILKQEYPHVRTLISVGGWTWSTHFSDVALTPESRARFAASCVAFAERYEFDGVDIDWEYPVSGGLPDNTYRPEDKQNFTLLLAELRTQLDAAGDYLLTIAAPASPIIMENIEIDLIHPCLDWLNVMTYDFHGPWGGDFDQVTNSNSPLHVASDDPNPEPAHSEFNLETAILSYLAWGVPREKLHPGLAFYGRGYNMVPDHNNGLFADYVGPSWNGTWEPGVFDFWDLRHSYIDLNGYTSFRHAESAVPWLFNPGVGVMISYDDPTSIDAKGDLINSLNLGGAMFWEFSADKEAELLETIHETIIAGGSASVGDIGTGLSADVLRLRAIAPNPCASQTMIRFDLAGPAHTRVRIYNVAGRLVRTLLDAARGTGGHLVIWNRRDGADRPIPSGVYRCVVTAGPASASRPLVVID